MEKIITTLGTKVTDEDIILVNDIKIVKEEKVYYILNKARNTISASSDNRDRKTVIDSLDSIDKRIYPVGRLDFDTTGVLLLTNDGELTNKLLHPSSKINKTYIVTLEGILTEKTKTNIRKKESLLMVKLLTPAQ